MKKTLFAFCLSLPFAAFSQTTPPKAEIIVAEPMRMQSINGTNPPLLVLDSAVFSFKENADFSKKINSINPDSIESMNVLKGQQAVDAFGEKGTNGVIVITMKKASSTIKKTSGSN